MRRLTISMLFAVGVSFLSFSVARADDQKAADAKPAKKAKKSKKAKKTDAAPAAPAGDDKKADAPANP